MGFMIKEIINEYWQASLPELKARDFDFSLVQTDLINDFIGIRRAGKTYLLFFVIQHLLEDKKIDKRATLYINFENRKLYPLKKDYFNQLIELIFAEKLLERFKKVYLFLDEVQNVPAWQKYLRSIYDEFKGRIKMFISGSNAAVLEKEDASLLTGRHLSINTFPLSFKEFLRFNNLLSEDTLLLERERSIIKKALEDYLRFGGFPEVVLSSSKEQILQQYFSDIISRDVVFKQNIRKGISVVEDLGLYLLNNICCLSSFRRLTNLFNSKGTKISLPTLEGYFRFFLDAFLFFSTRIFSYNIKDQFQHPLKIYCADTGLVSSLTSTEPAKRYENIVAVELRRRKKFIYYWKDYQYNEVDFLIKDSLKPNQLIQVSVEEEQTKQSPKIDSLLKAGKELKCEELLVITRDYEAREIIKDKAIIFIPLWKWLL